VYATMRTILYKIPMPFTLEQYSRAMLYTTTEVSKRETGKGSGIEVLKNEPVKFTLPDNSEVECQFTDKIYHCERMTPNFMKSMLTTFYGKNILKFSEISHNAFPFINTCSHNLEQPDRFTCNCISMHLTGKGEIKNPKHLHDNAFFTKNKKNSKLHEKSFDKVPVTIIDITKDIPGEKVNFKYDPTKFKSQALNIGPLPASTIEGNWWDNWKGPIMCVYKFSSIEINFWPMNTRMEKSFFKNQEVTITKMHKQMFCFADEWGPMTMAQVSEYEKEVQLLLASLILNPDVEFEYEVTNEEEGKKGKKAASTGQKRSQLAASPTVDRCISAASPQPSQPSPSGSKRSRVSV
jgi:hypothetical protein